MIISEEKDYFIYGCITTVFIESLLCLFYGCCCEKRCEGRIKSNFGKFNSPLLGTRNLLIENESEFDNTFENINSSSSEDDRYIDL